MLMKLFWNGRTGSLEGYRALLRRYRQFACGLALLGLATVAFSFWAVPRLPVDAERLDFFGGFYAGVGSGVTAAAVIWLARLRRLLGDEAALKRAYTKDNDERNREIDTRALLSAGVALVCVLYAVLLVAGMFYPVLFWFCLAAALLYSVLTLAFRAYYSHTM